MGKHVITRPQRPREGTDIGIETLVEKVFRRAYRQKMLTFVRNSRIHQGTVFYNLKNRGVLEYDIYQGLTYLCIQTPLPFQTDPGSVFPFHPQSPALLEWFTLRCAMTGGLRLPDLHVGPSHCVGHCKPIPSPQPYLTSKSHLPPTGSTYQKAAEFSVLPASLLGKIFDLYFPQSLRIFSNHVKKRTRSWDMQSPRKRWRCGVKFTFSIPFHFVCNVEKK